MVQCDNTILQLDKEPSKPKTTRLAWRLCFLLSIFVVQLLQIRFVPFSNKKVFGRDEREREIYIYIYR